MPRAHLAAASAVLALMVSAHPFAQSPAAKPVFSVAITMNDAPAAGVVITQLVAGKKSTEAGVSLKPISDKYAKGWRVDVYRRVCADDSCEVLLVPSGEMLPVEDKDCIKSKEPIPGAPCRCGWLGAFSIGENVTIDVENGTLKVK